MLDRKKIHYATIKKEHFKYYYFLNAQKKPKTILNLKE